MSFLDMYQGDQAAQDNYIMRHSAGNLPVTFEQGFDAAISEGRLFGQSVAGENARQDALQDHIDNIEKKTGKNVASEIDWSGMAMGGAMTADMLREQVNTSAAKLGQPELSADELEQAAVAKSRAAKGAYADTAAQESTLGGKIGMFAGGVASSATDPINLLALLVAPETSGVGIIGAALRWGAVAGVSQAAIEATGAPYREEVQPGYLQSGEPLGNIIEAVAGASLLGASTKALGNLWTRVKSGSWPTSVRDAGNIVESDANVANTNVYPGVTGEVTHREALTKTIDDVIGEHPIDVSATITPEVEAARATRIADIMAGREEALSAQTDALAERAQLEATAAPGLPFEQTAKEAEFEGRVGDMAFGIQRIAQDAGYGMERGEAETVANRLLKSTPEEAQDILRDLQMSPRQVADQPVRIPRETTDEPIGVAPPDKVTASPDYEQAIRADIDRDRMTGDRQIPVDVDKDGNAVYRSVDGAMNEVDAYNLAADHITACAAPVPDEDAA